LEALNPHSLKVVQAIVEPSLLKAMPDDKFQFERLGYFVADRADHSATHLVFNQAVGLKDSWGK
jgi:glutaminyl-tRNA synthetase